VPFEQILRVAKRLRCDLIVLATHGRTGLQHVLMGSVAENVVRRAPCPVLTVRPPRFTS
jgi:nucleotide-binding universal stress UspA family protein